MGKRELTQLLACCWPLHPLVTLLLGRMFRKLAQNERSVFAFLESTEPLGLRDFLTDSEHAPCSLYSLDHVYDYLVGSVGEGLYSQWQGKRWAEVDTVLTRLADPDPLHVRLIKTAGLVGAIGDWRNLRASREVLEFALSPLVGQPEVRTALDDLKKKSAIVFRRHSDSYSLWEGSDVDLDEAVRTARGRLAPSVSLIDLLTRYVTIRPIVARRHSFESGCLRYFDVQLVTVERAETQLPMRTDADGSLVILIPQTPEDQRRAVTIVKSRAIKTRDDTLVGVPNNTQLLADVIHDLACFEWVRENTPELAGDATARRELRARIALLRRQVDAAVASLFAPSGVLGAGCEWFYRGKKQKLEFHRSLNELLSRICDELYHATPRIRNELINRRGLSSSAAAARRNLIEAMITRQHQPELGIDGYPPEKSMYLSLLAAPRIHRKTRDGWQFAAPAADTEGGMAPVWRTMVDFFATTEKTARPLIELYRVLASPPFGLKPGPLPVLFVAGLLANGTNLALYEDGSFVPQLNVATAERLLRSPATFSVQRWRFTGLRAQVFQRMAEMLGRDGHQPDKDAILIVVRPLCRFAGDLNEYTKYTKDLSEVAVRIRTALLQARQPDKMLFEDLPRACGIEVLAEHSRTSAADLDSFIVALRNGLDELHWCYDGLLARLAAAIVNALGTGTKLPGTRRRFEEIAAALDAWVVDPKLRSFLIRAADRELDDAAWIESVTAVLAHKPPAVWRDGDSARFEVELAKTARHLLHLEALAFANTGPNGKLADPDVESIRIGITTRDAPELERVARISPQSQDDVERLELEISRLVENAGTIGQSDVALAALARVTQKLIK